jgi:hypothetical protein
VEPAPPPVPAGPLYSYEARLAPLDHVNSKGISLSDVAAVLRQDRARFHAGRGEAEDGTDTAMQEEAGRDAFERLARGSTFAAAVVEAVTTRNPKVKVTVWADRVEAEVLDPGTEEVACVVSDGKVVGIRWDSDFHEAKLLPRWATKGWSLSDHDSTRQLKTPTGALAAEFIHTTGNSIEMRGQHCTTAFGVGIGKSLASIKNDNFLKKAMCMCDNGPKEASVYLNSADFGYRLHARCSKPLSCKEDEVHIQCVGNWKRDDCIITTFEVGVPAD